VVVAAGCAPRRLLVNRKPIELPLFPRRAARRAHQLAARRDGYGARVGEQDQAREYQTGSRLYAVYTHSQEIERNVELGEAAGAGLHTLRRAPSVDTLLFKLAVWWGN
jgi:hypothetical protein